MKRSGYSRSFQCMTNKKMAVADNEGRDNGIATFVNIFQFPAPSIVDTSNNSFGKVFIKPVRMKTAIGKVTAIFTNIRPRRLLVKPRSSIREYKGTILTWAGTIIPRVNKPNKVLPSQLLSRTMPNEIIAANNSVSETENKVTIELFKK